MNYIESIYLCMVIHKRRHRERKTPEESQLRRASEAESSRRRIDRETQEESYLRRFSNAESLTTKDLDLVFFFLQQIWFLSYLVIFQNALKAFLLSPLLSPILQLQSPFMNFKLRIIFITCSGCK